MISRRAAWVFGVIDLLTAALLGIGVFVALPARWLPVDLPAALLVVLHCAAGGLLLRGDRRACLVATAAAGASLVLGLALVTTLALTAGWLSGIYGAVGTGGALILLLVGALVVPYLVALPAVQLVWVLPHARLQVGRS
jgi:hypothetical protein